MGLLSDNTWAKTSVISPVESRGYGWHVSDGEQRGVIGWDRMALDICAQIGVPPPRHMLYHSIESYIGATHCAPAETHFYCVFLYRYIAPNHRFERPKREAYSLLETYDGESLELQRECYSYVIMSLCLVFIGVVSFSIIYHYHP